MNLEGLRNECRRLLNDKSTTQPRTTDDQLDLLINEAEKEACIRGNLIIDSSDALICEIDVTIGVSDYKISDQILDIVNVTLPSATRPLGKRGYKFFDEEDINWKTRTATPDNYLLDTDLNKLVLSHLPIIDETLTLTVSRLPVNQMEDGKDEPEINVKYHYPLVYWALHLVYLSIDVDQFDANMAERFEARFDKFFGPRKTNKDIEHNLRKYRRRAKAQFM